MSRRIKYENSRGGLNTRKKYTNPFFNKKKKKRTKKKTSLKNFFSFLLFFIIIFTIIWFIYSSNAFAVKKINIEGINRTNVDSVHTLIDNQRLSRKFLFFYQDNMFILNQKELISNLKGSFNLLDVIIEKKMPHTLNIRIIEREHSFILQEGEKCYNMDCNGYIIETVDDINTIDGKTSLIIENKTDQIIKDNQNKTNLKSEDIEFSIDIFKKLNNTEGLNINKIIIDSEINTIKVKTDEGPEIYFNTEEDIEKQITKLLLVKEKTLKDNFNNKKYIDLRYGDKVYYLE